MYTWVDDLDEHGKGQCKICHGPTIPLKVEPWRKKMNKGWWCKNCKRWYHRFGLEGNEHSSIS